jgi:hypothetical protein
MNTSGNHNTANGYYSLFNNTTGWNNTAFGDSTLQANTTAWFNTAIGSTSLNSNIDGWNNTAIGHWALRYNTSGSQNTANGNESLFNNTTGNYNTANGFQSLYSNSTGSNNTANGVNSLYNITTGSNNTALGYNTARGITTGVANTILGANVTGLATTLSNNIIIADGNGNQRINVTATGNVGIGTATPTEKLEVAGNIKVNGTITIADGLQGTGKFLTSDINGLATWTIPTSSLITEGINLYFTNTRAQNALSGTISRIDASIATATGNIATLSGNFITLSGTVGAYATSINTLSGRVSASEGDISTLSGSLVSLTATIASKISLTSLSVLWPLTYNNLSGVFGIAIANSTTTGALSATDWNTFNNKENVLNFTGWLTRTGNTIGMGAVTGGILSWFTGWQLTFGSPSGGLTQSANLFWDALNGRLGIGTSTPAESLSIVGNTLLLGRLKVDAWNVNKQSEIWTNFSSSGGGVLNLKGNNNGNYSQISIDSGDFIKFFVSNTERMSINSSWLLTVSGGLTTLSDATINGITVGLGGGNNLFNVAFGSGALKTNTAGGSNVAIGAQALFSNSTAWSNTAIGDRSLYTNTTGYSNIGVGSSVSYSNTTWHDNIGVGNGAFYNNSTGSQNVAIGHNALRENLASNNTALGYGTARGITTGVANTILGANVTGLAAGLSNNIIIADGNGTRGMTIDTIVNQINIGLTNSVTGTGATAIGRNNTANGLFATVLGSYNTLTATGSTGNTVIGYLNSVSNWLDGAVVGSYNVSNGSWPTIFGRGNISNGSSDNAMMFGKVNTVSYHNGIAIWLQNIAAGWYGAYLGGDNPALAIWGNNNTNGIEATAVGMRNTVSNFFTSAFGFWNNVSASGASAFGNGITNTSIWSTMIGPNNTAKITILSGGTVGIGTATPSYKLDVAGTGSFSGFRLTTGATSGYVLTTDALGNATWQSAAAWSGWGLSGNAGTNPLTQFIGTTDNQDLVFKRNNIEGFRLSGASGNLVTTADAVINWVNVGRGNGINASNVAIGSGALSLNTTGNENTAVGYLAGSNTATGVNNSFFGYEAWKYNVWGVNNSFFGDRAGRYNIGDRNSFFGQSAWYSNTTWFENTFIGKNGWEATTVGSRNVSLGAQSFAFNTTWSGDTVIGARSLFDSVSGNNNTVLGYNTALGIITGSANTILGANVTGLAAGLSNNIIIADGSGNRRINVDATGNVGIGTDTPTALLDVMGDVVIHALAKMDSIQGLDYSNLSIDGGWSDSGPGGNVIIQWGYGVTGGNVLLVPNAWFPNLAWNVGIGTATPTERLEVNGNIKLNGDITTDTDGIYSIGTFLTSFSQAFIHSIISSNIRADDNTDLNIVAWSRVFSLDSGSNVVVNGSAKLGWWSFKDGNVILANIRGNVGIGTTAPNYKLDVAGTGSFYNIRISSGATAGYVLTTNSTGNASWQAASGGGWGLAGNIGTNPLTQFIGTTDNQDLVFRTNNTEKLRILAIADISNQILTLTGGDATINGLRVGRGSGNISTNTAIGNGSLQSNTTGYENTTNGYRSLYSNTTGFYNTANGYRSLYSNTTGYTNTANGYQSLYFNSSGFNNTANGLNSLFFNTTGTNNTANGRDSLYSNTTGTNNTANGRDSLNSNTVGYQNTAHGDTSLYNNTTGFKNTAIGYNTAIGIITGSANTILGANVTGLAASLSNNIIIADGDGNRRINVDATGKVGIGTNTPSAKLDVNGNMRVSGDIMPYLNWVTSIGEMFQSFAVWWIDNLYSNTIVATDFHDLRLRAWLNDGVGGRAYDVYIDSWNWGFWADGKILLATANNARVGIGTTTPNYKLEVQGDINAIGTVRANGIALTSDARFKQGVATIMNSVDILSRLNPVTYTWNLLGQQHGGKVGSTEYGFLAQDVESILPSAVSTSADGYKSLNYIDFIPHLVGAIKEIIETDSVFSGSLSSITTSVTNLTNSYTTLTTNMTSLKNSLDAQGVALETQSLALSQMQQTVVDLQSQVSTLNLSSASDTPAPIINNYYTTVIETGSTNTGTTIINNYYTTGSTESGETNNTNNTNNNINTNTLFDHSGSIEWTHSWLLLAELTGSTELTDTTNTTTTGTIITPRIAILYISQLFDTATDVVHNFVALRITAVHGYFDEIWTTKINTRELVASWAIINQAHVGTLCVKKSDNTEICLTGDQLETLFASAPSSTTPTVETITTNIGSTDPIVDTWSTDTGSTDNESTGSTDVTSDSGATDSGATTL